MDDVIVVSLRKGAPPIPEGYTAVRIDRENPLLGSPFVLKNKNDAEGRRQVIEDFRSHLRTQMRSKSPTWMAVIELANRVQAGEKLALQCWCCPKACHGDVIKKAIEGILLKRGYNAASQQTLTL